MFFPDSELINEVEHFKINPEGDLITSFHTERSKRNHSTSREIDDFLHRLATEVEEPTLSPLLIMSPIYTEKMGDHENKTEELLNLDSDADVAIDNPNLHVAESNTSSVSSAFERNFDDKNYELNSFEGLITTISTILLYLSTTKAATTQAYEYIIGNIRIPHSKISLSNSEAWIWMQAEISNRISLQRGSIKTDTMNMSIKKFLGNLQEDSLVLREEMIMLKQLVKAFLKVLNETHAYLEKLEKIALKKFTEAATLVNEADTTSAKHTEESSKLEEWDTEVLDYTEQWVHYDKGEILIRTSTTEQSISLNSSTHNLEQLIKTSRIIQHGIRVFLKTSNSLFSNLYQVLKSKPVDQKYELKQLLRHLKMQMRSTYLMYPAQQAILHSTIKKMKALIDQMESISTSLKTNIKSSTQLLESSLGNANIDAFDMVFTKNSKFTMWRSISKLQFTLKIESPNSTRILQVNTEKEHLSTAEIIKEIMKSETELHMMMIDNNFEDMYKNRFSELLLENDEIRLTDVELCRSKIQTIAYDCVHIIKILDTFDKTIHEVNARHFSEWDISPSSPHKKHFSINLWFYLTTECLLNFRSQCMMDSNMKKELKTSFEKCFKQLSEFTIVAKKAGTEYMKICSMIEMLIFASETEIQHCVIEKSISVNDSNETSTCTVECEPSGSSIKLCLTAMGLVIKIKETELQFNLMHQNLQTKVFNLILGETTTAISTISSIYAEALSFVNNVQSKSYPESNISQLINRTKDILSKPDEITQLELIVLKRSLEELQGYVTRLCKEIGFFNPFRREKLLKELNFSKQLVFSCFLKKRDASEIMHVSNILGGTVEILVRNPDLAKELSSIILSNTIDIPTTRITLQNSSSKNLELLKKSNQALMSTEKLIKYLSLSQAAFSFKSEKPNNDILHYDAISTFLLLILLEINPKDRNVLKILKSKQKSIQKNASKINGWMKRNLHQKLRKMEWKFRSMGILQDSCVQRLKLISTSGIDAEISRAQYIKLRWNHQEKHIIFNDFTSNFVKFSQISCSIQEDTVLRILQMLNYKTTFIKEELAKSMKTFKQFYSSTLKLKAKANSIEPGSENLQVIQSIYNNFNQLKYRLELIYLKMESLQAKLQIGLNLIKNYKNYHQTPKLSKSNAKFNEYSDEDMERARFKKQIYEIPIPLEIYINY